MRIAFIGGGNMASAIVGGLKATGFDMRDVIVFEPSTATAASIREQYGCHIASTNTNACLFIPQTHDSIDSDDEPHATVTPDSAHSTHADIIVLAVKPQIMPHVCRALGPTVKSMTGVVVVSIAAGILCGSIDAWLGSNVPVVRTMPNTPALVGEGATGMYASELVSAAQREMVSVVMRAISKRMYWVEKESLIDIVTGVSGSAPAYFFLLIESIEAAGINLGLPADIARGLAIQSCLGAGRMASESNVGPSELRQRVTSPNGTTDATAERLGMKEMWLEAVSAAVKRSEELGKDASRL